MAAFLWVWYQRLKLFISFTQLTDRYCIQDIRTPPETAKRILLHSTTIKALIFIRPYSQERLDKVSLKDCPLFQYSQHYCDIVFFFIRVLSSCFVFSPLYPQLFLPPNSSIQRPHSLVWVQHLVFAGSCGFKLRPMVVYRQRDVSPH